MAAPQTPRSSRDAPRFVGRERELEELHRTFGEGARLLSVLGPPGVGKTRLILEYARAWSHGAWICNARAARTPDQLCAALAATLGLPDADSSRLTAALDDRGSVLIAIDSFEQLVPAAVSTLEGWLTAAPEAQFLIGSRRRVGLRTEVVLDLLPLSHGDAVALYFARAEATRSDYQRTPAEERAVEDLVSRLGGLPLAIVLAAARIRSIGPAQLASRLSARLDLLTDGVTSLRTAIDDSWTALNDCLRDALAQASVFCGGFSLEAAEAVISVPASCRAVIDLLEELCDRSLVTWCAAGDPAHGMRFDIDVNIREYAREQLAASGRRADCEQRHATQVLSAATSWLAQGHLSRLAPEQANLLAIFSRSSGEQQVRAALALAALHTDRDATRKWLAALEDAARCLSADTALRGEVMLAQGAARQRLSLFTQAMADFEAAVEVATSADDQQLLARARLALGDALFDADDRLRAREAFESARAAAHLRGDQILEARAHIGLARAARNHPDAAREHLEASLQLLADAPDSIHVAAATLQLGVVGLRLGRLGEAREHLQQALDAFGRAGSASGEAEALAALAAIDHEQADLPSAAQRYAKSVALLRANGDLADEAESLLRQGACLAEQGLVEAARECFAEANAGFRLVGNAQGVSEVLGHLGVLEADLGNLAAAEDAFREAEGGIHSLPNHALLQVQRGHLDLARGDRQTATARYQAARSAHDGRGWALSHRSLPLRSAIRQLERALNRSGPKATSCPPDALVVATTGRWFRVPGGERVDLNRRGGLRRLLSALADSRVQNAGALSRDVLLEIGWPGERVQPESGARRVHTAIWSLRKLGLRELLQSRDDGYLLDPRVPLVRAEE